MDGWINFNLNVICLIDGGVGVRSIWGHRSLGIAMACKTQSVGVICCSFGWYVIFFFVFCFAFYLNQLSPE